MSKKSNEPDGYITQRVLGEDYQIPYYYTGNKKAAVERASWDENIENYPDTTPGVAIAITLGSMFIAWIAIQVIFGADDFIYWVAGLIA